MVDGRLFVIAIGMITLRNHSHLQKKLFSANCFARKVSKASDTRQYNLQIC
ncbi:hypothetical protein HMPREF0201_02426 [Cedecea davisae DSM 4568]|uniref:Uncharacterized protein n=1 Tax=Cedecea davisae DSM 4568 TaxID=566551 RepID=S3IUN1_9ENTR|nr:hypothetical protein HMPREF0201_02426 [Cedecea davisae DSM 4568]